MNWMDRRTHGIGGRWMVLAVAVLFLTACSANATTPAPAVATPSPLPTVKPTVEPPTPTAAPTEPASMYRAELVGSVKVDRSAGSGTCGIEPWRVRDCAEPKYWWGYRLEASMKAPLLVVPSDGSWVITNQPDTVVQYGLNPEELTSEGAYTAAEIDFGEERSRCSGTLVGRPFGVQVTGRLKNGQIQLLLAADPVEKLDATCSQKPVSAETHVLLAGWATALSGDPNDLTLFYDPESLSEDGLEYKRTVDSRTNPSPDMRDHAHTEMVFRCLKADEPHEVVACPWH